MESGVDLHLPRLTAAQRMQVYEEIAALGVDRARIEVYWADVERQSGTRDWSRVDEAVNALTKAGVSACGLLGFVPRWAGTAPWYVSAVQAQRYPPNDWTLWADFVDEAATRYAGRVSEWEIWNEPDGAFWKGTRSEFARLWSMTATTLRAVDPAALLVAPSMIDATKSAARGGYLDSLLHDRDHPCRDLFDVLNFHEYAVDLGRYAADVLALRSLLSRVGRPGLPIWLTETGQPSDPARQSDPRYAGPDGQAAWLSMAWPQLATMVDAAFWYEIVDPSSGGLVARSLGLLDGTPARKPAFEAYRSLLAAGGTA